MNGNKPDWKDAPKWAEYLAQDKNGNWYWYECRPIKTEDGFIVHCGYSCLAGRLTFNWDETLEERPE